MEACTYAVMQFIKIGRSPPQPLLRPSTFWAGDIEEVPEKQTESTPFVLVSSAGILGQRANQRQASQAKSNEHHLPEIGESPDGS